MTQRNRTRCVATEPGIALPDNADLEAVITEPRAPPGDDRLIGEQVGHRLRQMIGIDAEHRRQAHQRHLEIEAGAHAQPVGDVDHRKRALKHRLQRRGRTHHDFEPR